MSGSDEQKAFLQTFDRYGPLNKQSLFLWTPYVVNPFTILYNNYVTYICEVYLPVPTLQNLSPLKLCIKLSKLGISTLSTSQKLPN